MLRIQILAIGDHKDRWVAEACDHYIKLTSRWAKIDLALVPGLRGTSSMPPGQIMLKEAERLANEICRGTLVVLSDKGRDMDSMAFADLLRRFQNSSGGNVTFVIGGPYGLAAPILDRADFVLSLSPLTFSHQLARIVLLEQLYRGFSILHGTSYHK